MRKYIWGFPGVGKSSLKLPGLNIVDADCRLFEFKDVAKEDLHIDSKPRFYERDEAYPQNYLDYIQTVDADIILLNCHISLLEHLNKESVLLVYPSEQLMSEYIQRYIDRGDNPSFASYMQQEGPGIIEYINTSDYIKYRVLSRNTYLGDLFERNDFKMKLMNRAELTEQLQRAIDLKVIDANSESSKLICDLSFATSNIEHRINSAAVWAEAILDGEYVLDIDQLEKVCSQREAELEKERIFAERRGGLTREELADKIMQGIVNGALGVHHGQIAPYSYGYEVTFGGDSPSGSTRRFKNRWECYNGGFFDIPGKIADMIENEKQSNETFGAKVQPLDIKEMLTAIDEKELQKITSFTPEKDTDFERWGTRGYGSRGSIASVRDVHAGKALDGIAKGAFGGDYSSMTTSSQNDLVQTLVFMKGFCLDCLDYLHSRPGTENIIEYLKKHGTDVSTPEKLQEWIKANPEKCGKEENRVLKHFNEGHNLYAQAFCDFVELKSFVDSFKGSFVELCNELGGDRYSDNTFRLEYGVLALSIGRDLSNKIFLCDNAIGIWDEDAEEFLNDCVSFKYIKETCEEIGFDVKELKAKALTKSRDSRLSLAEQIAECDAKKRDGKSSVEPSKEKGEER